MEKYSKAVSEVYSQFKQKEAHPMEKYIGRLAYFCGGKSEVGGYRESLDPQDVVFKKCEKYCYVSVDNLID